MGPPSRRPPRRRRIAVVCGLLSAAALAAVPTLGRPAHADAVTDSMRVPDPALVLHPARAASSIRYGMAGDVSTFVIGESVQGRPIVAYRRQGSAPVHHLVVVGVIHGDETAGRRVTDALLEAPLPEDLQLTVLPTVNPDGEAAHRRTNARGVDLNRNFPYGWLPEGASEFTVGDYNPGPAPLSEPEAQAVHRWLDAARPDFTVWYHQPWNVVVCDAGSESRCLPLAGRLAMATEVAPRPGSAATWGSASGLAAAVVELPEHGIDEDGTARHVAALLAAFEPWSPPSTVPPAVSSPQPPADTTTTTDVAPVASSAGPLEAGPAVRGTVTLWSGTGDPPVEVPAEAAAPAAAGGPVRLRAQFTNDGAGVLVARADFGDAAACGPPRETLLDPGREVALTCTVGPGPARALPWAATLTNPADGAVVAAVAATGTAPASNEAAAAKAAGVDPLADGGLARTVRATAARGPIGALWVRLGR